MEASRSVPSALRRAHELLGVPAQADAAQVARAYRRLARRLHPDLSAEPDATEQFWALQAAYRVALDAAQDPGRRTLDEAAHHDVVVHRVPTNSGPRAGATPEQNGVPEQTRVVWLAAGPVHVRPPRGPDPRTRRGAEPMSSGEGA
jgi:hypothetical protein